MVKKLLIGVIVKFKYNITKVLLITTYLASLLITLASLKLVKPYVYLGYHWASPPYPDLYYLNECDGYEYRAVSDATNDWNNINAINPPDFKEYGPPLFECNVRVYETNRDEYYPDGICYRYYDSYAIIYYVEIEINNYWTSQYEYNKVRSVMAHEFGHALGLEDEDINKAVLMNGVTHYRYDVYGIYKPTQDEVNGINHIYGG